MAATDTNRGSLPMTSLTSLAPALTRPYRPPGTGAGSRFAEPPQQLPPLDRISFATGTMAKIELGNSAGSRPTAPYFLGDPCSLLNVYFFRAISPVRKVG